MKGKMLNTNEVIKALKISRNALYKHLNWGMPSRKLKNGERRYSMKQIEAWVNEQPSD